MSISFVAPKILWIGDCRERLKGILVALHCDTLHFVGVLPEVLKVITYLIASDLGIQYDEALGNLIGETASE